MKTKIYPFVGLRIFQINHQDTFAFLGLKNPLLKAFISPFLVLPGVYFTRSLVRLNRRVGWQGFVRALVWVLHRYYGPTESFGLGPEVRRGPLLAVCNHPGLGDFSALLEALGRKDVKVIVKQRELMRDLHSILSHCIVIDKSLASRARAIGEAVNYMKAGGVVVIFPAGEIEEDPALFAQGESMFKPWYPIVDSIARRCRKIGFDFTIQPALVDRVYSVPRLLLPYVRSSEDTATRSGRAAIITMILGGFRKPQIRVRFAGPIFSNKLHGYTFRGDLTGEVLSVVRGQLQSL